MKSTIVGLTISSLLRYFGVLKVPQSAHFDNRIGMAMPMKARKHDPRLPPGYEAEQSADGSVLLRIQRGSFERSTLTLFGIAIIAVFVHLLRAEIAYIADEQEVWKNLPSPEKWYGITIFGLTTGALILTVGLVGFTGLWNGLSQDALTLNRNLMVINQWFFAYHRQKRITDAHIVLEYHHSLGISS